MWVGILRGFLKTSISILKKPHNSPHSQELFREYIENLYQNIIYLLIPSVLGRLWLVCGFRWIETTLRSTF